MENLNIDLSFRKSKPGEEKMLIDSFFKTFSLELFKKETQSDFIILQEPNLSNNYPDIIIVIMDKDKVKSWNKNRLLLENKDIKIIHYLYSLSKDGNITDLLNNLGFNKNVLDAILNRLYKSEIVIQNNQKVLLKNHEDLFIISDIISIEAKIRNWKTAFYQAELNSLFSSESYVLLPKKAINERVISFDGLISSLGIICKAQKEFSIIRQSSKSRIPSSFNSWMLNEKIGRAIFNESI